MQTFKNNFLLAMPNLVDPMFKNSLVYICEHTSEGAMGLIINHPNKVKLNIFLQVGIIMEHLVRKIKPK